MNFIWDFKLVVLPTGLEPARLFRTADFKSATSTISITRAWLSGWESNSQCYESKSYMATNFITRQFFNKYPWPDSNRHAFSATDFESVMSTTSITKVWLSWNGSNIYFVGQSHTCYLCTTGQFLGTPNQNRTGILTLRGSRTSHYSMRANRLN